MSELSTKQQYSRVMFLGIAFMIMFTSFNSLQNIVSKLYDEYNYNHLGQTAVMFLYGAFGITTLFSSFIVKTLGYKKAMFFSSLGYGLFQSTGFLIVTGLDIPHIYVWILVLLGATICGISASVLWVAQGAYTSQVASQNRKSELFAVFWGLMMSSQIFGNLLITFILGKMTDQVYFILLTILGFSSSIIFLFLPSVTLAEPVQTKQNQTTIKQQLAKVWAIASNKKYTFLNMYFWFPGLTVSFYAGFLYKLISLSVKQRQDQSKQDFKHELNFKQGLVFIVLGLSQVLCGLVMNRIGQKFCKFKLAIIGTYIVQIAGIVSFICYFAQSYPLCFLCAFLWGASQNYLQTNTGGLIGKLFPGKVEAFSVYRVFFSIGVVSVLLLNIILSSFNPLYFLTFVFVASLVITFASFKLNRLKISEDQKKNSLLNSQVEN